MNLVSAARALRADIAAHVDAMEAERSMPAPLSDRIRDAGLYAMLMPSDLGGGEVSPQTYFDAVEAVAEADASAGWCTMISASTAYLSAFLPRDVARTLFGTAGTVASGVFAPMGKAVTEGDSYRLAGRWRWNSNGRNSTVLTAGSLIVADGEVRRFAHGAPDHRMLIFSAAHAEFIDTWHTMGLKGTGSGDFAVSDLVVPAAHSVSLFTDPPRVEAPLYAFPAFGLLALGIAATASGNARSAMAEFAALATTKTPQASKRTLSERATVQADYAMCEARLASARAFVAEVVGMAECAAANGRIPVADRARLRLACTHMTRTAADVCRVVHDMAGGSAVFLASPLQRRLRDAETMTAHLMVAPPTYEVAARAAFGLSIDDMGL
jgi:alkylation response protein AidB-like acyl-CoA dehydrogenase